MGEKHKQVLLVLSSWRAVASGLTIADPPGTRTGNTELSLELLRSSLAAFV